MKSRLADLEVLALDCQATGADPAKSRLLEVGWLTTGAADREEVPESYLLRWPEGEEIPPRVQRVTGIRREELISQAALGPAEIWQRLTAAARDVARRNRRETCPTVIHFSRFEEGYLRHLHNNLASDSDFPFHIICTHEIVKRLLPDLPRRGLRPVAGHFGHSVPELRRSAHHAVATIFIWKRLVERLEATQGVRTEAELRQWLERTKTPASSGRVYPMEPSIRLCLPDHPGVYRMLRCNGDLLYVGKARNLRRRVNSYFQTRRHHAEHTLEMLTQASRLDFTVTETALEAALLESDEIKRASPPYNIALRERDRRVTFFSSDCLETLGEPDDDHPIGPLPTVDGLRFLGYLADALRNGHQHLLDDWPTKTGILSGYAPEKECMRAGLEMFEERYFREPPRPIGVSMLTRLGARLWRERLDTTEAEEEDEDTESGEKWEWTPERVISWLENRALRGAYLIRRARWLCLLSESALAWQTRNTNERNKTLLVFSEGVVVHREVLDADAPTPSPPGVTRVFRERQRSFDLATYDRLSVVTTELKRLLYEGRHVELRLSPKTPVSHENLARGLRWV